MEGCINRVPDEVIIIEDDGDGEVENHDSRNGGNRFHYDCDSSSSSDDSDESEFVGSDTSDSSDEDCIVVEPQSASSLSSRRVRLGVRGLSNINERGSNSNDSSDCEIIADTNGKVREDWEKAASRRRMGNSVNHTRRRAESEESTSVSNHANGGPEKQSSIDDIRFHEDKKQEHMHACQNGHANSASEMGSRHAKPREDSHVVFDQQDSNPDVLNGGSEDTSEEATLVGNVACGAANVEEILECKVDSAGIRGTGKLLSNNSSPAEDCNIMEASTSLVHTHVDSVEAVRTDLNPLTVKEVFTDREKLKETKEFQNADAEEWERRRLELEKQSQEAQRERKRRKVEGERRQEMENRQRQRLEEIRESQLKEERTSGYKEKVRDRIQSELDNIAATCKDMATLLCRLGIQVEGGPYPTNQQVNAAYKKAILRFHPDRVTAVAGSDLSQQVKAEETFKLISRMKTVLPPVANGYLHSFVGSL